MNDRFAIEDAHQLFPKEVASVIQSVFRLLSQETVNVTLPPSSCLCQPLVLWSRDDEYFAARLTAWVNPLDGELVDVLLELRPIFPQYWFPAQLKSTRNAYLWLVYNLKWKLYDDQDKEVPGSFKEDSEDRAIKYNLWTFESKAGGVNLCLEFDSRASALA